MGDRIKTFSDRESNVRAAVHESRLQQIEVIFPSRDHQQGGAPAKAEELRTFHRTTWFSSLAGKSLPLAAVSLSCPGCCRW